jgi:hypothetical protein
MDGGPDAGVALQSTAPSMSDQEHDWSTRFTGVDTRAANQTSTDPNANEPNQSVDPNAGQPNQSVDPNAGPNQSIDPNAGPNQSVDPNAGQPNQSVDPNAGPNQSIDPNAGPNQSVDPNAGQPNQSVDPNAGKPAQADDPSPPTPPAPEPEQFEMNPDLYNRGFRDGKAGSIGACPANTDAAGEASYEKGFADGKREAAKYTGPSVGPPSGDPPERPENGEEPEKPDEESPLTRQERGRFSFLKTMVRQFRIKTSLGVPRERALKDLGIGELELKEYERLFEVFGVGDGDPEPPPSESEGEGEEEGEEAE